MKIGSLGTRFHITKYPTLKYVRNGQLAKREYRGQRSADAFLNFVKEQNKDPVKEFKELKDLTDVDGQKRYIIGYFEDKNSLQYANFRKSAMNLKDDCVFHAGFGEVKPFYSCLPFALIYTPFLIKMNTNLIALRWIFISDGKTNASTRSIYCCV